MKKIILFIISVLSIFISSCQNSEVCREDMEVSLAVAFFRPIKDTTTQKISPKPLSDTIKIVGVGSDAVLNATSNISKYRLPLKPFANTTSFVLQRIHKEADTVTFIHQNEEKFVSLACGVKIIHRLTEVKSSNYEIDSVKIINGKVRDNKTENQVNIYFKIDR